MPSPGGRIPPAPQMSMTERETHMFELICPLQRDESGATAIEYGLIASLIAVSIITAVTLIGVNLSAKFTALANAF